MVVSLDSNSIGSRHSRRYTFAVTFEAINQDIPIYEPIKIENQIEIEVRI